MRLDQGLDKVVESREELPDNYGRRLVGSVTKSETFVKMGPKGYTVCRGIQGATPQFTLTCIYLHWRTCYHYHLVKGLHSCFAPIERGFSRGFQVKMVL